MKLTSEQHQAITTRDVSIGLSSGAGCGKTFVLTQRLLAHLEEGGSLQELAAITFTERAAREMRDRIRERIHDYLHSAKTTDDRQRWLQHSRELESARISTIHAFCGSFLRANAVESGLDPNFATLDQAQAESLLSTVIDDELRRQLADRNEDAIQLIISFALRDVTGMIRALLEKRADLDLDTWQAATADDLLDRWQAYFQAEYLPRQLQELTESELSREVIELLSRHRSTNRKMEEFRTTVLAVLPTLAQSDDLTTALDELIQAARVQGGGGAKAWTTPDVYASVRDTLKRLRDKASDLRKRAEFDRQAARNAAENGLRLLRVTTPIIEEYTRRKRELASLDFDDLLILTRDLLRDSKHASLRKRTAASLKLLLVDELQDTDPLQIELVKTLCDGNFLAGRVFVVGDYKQSIYRFRGADPRVFRDLLDELPPAGRLSLTTSFRSQPGVLDFVNATFHEPFTPEYEPLEPHRQQHTPGPNTEFIWAVQQEDDVSANEARRAEARLIAQRIREMLDGEERIVVDRSAEKRGVVEARRAREEDIALLFRALSDVQFYEEALRAAGIKYYLVGGHAFYAQQEIYDVLNVLRTLAHPDDEVAAIGALRSPIFSLADETFYWLFRQPEGFRAAIFGDVAPPPELDEQQRRQVFFAARTLTELRAMKDRVTISTLLDEVLRRTGYDATLLVEFLGDRKLANIRKLVNQARSFQSSDGFALDEFISRLAEFVASKPREALAAIHPETAGVVRLMTIHQAKGLEFPIVFVPDIDRREVTYSPRALFHPRLGPLVRQHRDEENKTATGLAMIRGEEDQEERAETTRLFYVATTRAADHLVLSSSLGGFDKLHGPWTRLLSERFDLRSGQFRGSLPEDWSAPQVHVFAPEEDTETSSRSRRVSINKVVADVRQSIPHAGGVTANTIAPVPADTSARREFSFSRLSGTLREDSREHAGIVDEHSASKATTDRDAALSLGTFVHEVLERIDFSDPAAIDTLTTSLAAKQETLTEELRRDATEMIGNLLQSPLAKRLAAAQTLEREIDFLLHVPGAIAGQAGSAVPCLRGVIDLLYQDTDGAWHVLDYKTNNVTAATVPRSAASYELQMFVYAEAVRNILGVEPESVSLYFLRPGMEHSFRFDQDDRLRLERSLREAINRLTGDRTIRDAGHIDGSNLDQRHNRDGTHRDVTGPPPPFTLKADSRRRVTRKR